MPTLPSPYGEELDMESFPLQAPSAKTSTPLDGWIAELVETYGPHVEELRNRILWCVGITVTAMIVMCFFSQQLILALEDIARPLMQTLPSPSNGAGSLSGEQALRFVQLTPGESLFTSLKVAVIGGLMFSLPVWLYHGLRFVLPGLTRKEKPIALAVLLGGTLLFVAGALFGSTVVLPAALPFLLGYGTDIAQLDLSIGRYVEFCLALMGMTGLMFELPMVLIGLSLTGLISSALLIKKWREVTVLLFVIAAVLTPSQDPITLCIVGGVLLGLYALSLGVIRILGR